MSDKEVMETRSACRCYKALEHFHLREHVGAKLSEEAAGKIEIMRDSSCGISCKQCEIRSLLFRVSEPLNACMREGIMKMRGCCPSFVVIDVCVL